MIALGILILGLLFCLYLFLPGDPEDEVHHKFLGEVHHINGDPSDNRPENLQLVDREDHS